MASAMNRRHRKRCKAMSTSDLRTLIKALDPEVREATSLLECAKQEYRKRSRKEREEEEEEEEEGDET